MVKPVDGILFFAGIALGYFLVDIWKSTIILIQSLPPAFLIGAGLLLIFAFPKLKIPGDIITGMGFGLAIRGQVTPV